MKFAIMYYLVIDGEPMTYTDNAWEAPECCRCSLQEAEGMVWEIASNRYHTLCRVYPNNTFELKCKVVSYA